MFEAYNTNEIDSLNVSIKEVFDIKENMAKSISNMLEIAILQLSKAENKNQLFKDFIEKVIPNSTSPVVEYMSYCMDNPMVQFKVRNNDILYHINEFASIVNVISILKGWKNDLIVQNYHNPHLI